MGAKCSETWKTRNGADRLPASRHPVNVNKAALKQEMRKGEKEDRRGEKRGDSGGGGGGGGGTIIKASFLQRTIKSCPRRAAEHKSISFSRLQAPRF